MALNNIVIKKVSFNNSKGPSTNNTITPPEIMIKKAYK
jgi:hypothetical protein